MFNQKYSVLFVLGLFLTGCSSMGNAPAGQSPEEAKAAFEAQSPEEKIKIINSSPMQPDEKAKRINEIKQKAGMPVDTPAAAPSGQAPPPAAAGGPAVGSFPGDPRSGK